MKPTDFVIFDGDGSNASALKVAEAMKKEIMIAAVDGDYEILSYYMTDKGMVLDIEKKKDG